MKDRFLDACLGWQQAMPPGFFEPLRDIVGDGPFRLKPGEWTDDTSMALGLAESLIEQRGFDPCKKFFARVIL